MEIIKTHRIILTQEDIKHALYNYLKNENVLQPEVSLDDFDEELKFDIKETGCIDEGNYKRILKSIEINIK